MRTYRPDLLNALANYLKKLPATDFDLRHFVGKKDQIFQADPEMAKKLKGNPNLKEIRSCGATACALGHAPSVPELAQAGLKVVVYNPTKEDKENWDDTVRLQVTYKGETDFYAATKLFGIPMELAEHFFDPENYKDDELNDPKIVARRIHEFISNPVEYMEWNKLMYWS